MYNQYIFIVPAPSITVTNDTVTVDSTATLVCSPSISVYIPVIITATYEWTGPGIGVKSGNTLIISSVDVNDAGQYMCTSTASYTGNVYILDSNNTAPVYLIVERKLIMILNMYYTL